MSTRTNILIKTPEHTIYLYRHCDGYPEVTGRHLKQFLQDNSYSRWESYKLATDLIQYHEHSEWSNEDYYPYELTYCVHGDIEYLYVIEVRKATTKLTAYAVRGSYEDEKDIIKPDNIIEI